jgi:hypothetical protein
MNKEFNIKIKGDTGDFSMLVISAVRYALGKRTYIVNWTCEFVSNNLNLLTIKDAKVVINDILEQEQKYGLGDKCDQIDWHNLLDKIFIYLNESGEYL